MPLRIAFINPSGEIGGAERSMLLLLDGLDRQRYEPVVVCSFEGRLQQALAALQVPCLTAPLGSLERFSRFSGGLNVREAPGAALGVMRAAVELACRLKSIRPHLIHTNHTKAHLVGGISGRLLRCPVLWHVRDLMPEGRMLGLFRAAADRLPRRIVANSAAVAAQFSGTRAAADTRTVHNAVSLERFRPSRSREAVRAELGFAPETVVLAMVAHFTHWKGHTLFLDTLARLIRQQRPVAGLIVGGSIYRTEGHEDCEASVRAYSRDLGLAERVRFTGYQDCVADYLNAADILVHPPTRPEPFGRSLIEAMALEKPVVAAAAGGVLEIVEADRTGLLVPPGDAGAFAAAVASLAADPQRRKQMGIEGRERVQRLFTPEVHVRSIQQVYQEMFPAMTVVDRHAPHTTRSALR